METVIEIPNVVVTEVEATSPLSTTISIPGPRGKDGAPGLTGPRGEQGPPGPKGDPFKYKDFTEEQLKALMGPKGNDGKEGPRGPKGDPFRYEDFTPEQLEALKVKGDKGDPGIQGIQGLKGEPFRYSDFTSDQLDILRGPMGPRGEDGPKGDPFTYNDFTPEQLEKLKGPKGDRGLQGPQGKPFTYEDFTQEQLNALKVKGDKGEQGDKGADGLQGPKGDPFRYSDFTQEQLNALKVKGDPGPRGADGLQGPKGEQGYTPNFTFTVEANGDLYVDIEYNPSSAAVNVSTETIIYDVIWGNAKPGSPGNGRGYLEYSPLTGFGKLHLDTKLTTPSGNGSVVCTLPNEAPVPMRLLETAVDADNNSIYIEPNSRQIKGWGVPNNKRYIFDIVGFWKVK